MNEQERKERAFTVMLRYAPRPWMSSLDEVTDLPVRCVISNGYRGPQLDLATPLFPLPDEIVRPETPHRGQVARSAFRNALQEAVAAHIRCDVMPVAYGVVDWGDEPAPGVNPD